jgi:hypothetical protein
MYVIKTSLYTLALLKMFFHFKQITISYIDEAAKIDEETGKLYYFNKY